MPGCSNCPSDTAIASQRADPLFRRVLWVALIANAVMFVVEIIASQLGNSISLQADALDFFGDAANYAIIVCIGNGITSARPRLADQRCDHGRFWYMGDRQRRLSRSGW